jgi:hypothetical protein
LSKLSLFLVLLTEQDKLGILGRETELQTELGRTERRELCIRQGVLQGASLPA